MPKIQFTKMHGIGNDYIYLDCLDEVPANPAELSKILSDRHFSIGGDGLVLIMSSDKADYRMRMFNADGSEAQMCGNAIRCVGKYLFDKGITSQSTITIETGAGIMVLEMTIENSTVSLVRVDMGEPILEGPAIPTTFEDKAVLNAFVTVDGQEFSVNCVSMGNPHAVIPVEEITDELVLGWGPKLEVAPEFPQRCNIEFITALDRNTIQMRVWERGSGETLACGTGACAVAVASALLGNTERKVDVQLLGGTLNIEWADNNHVYMTGPAAFSFEGTVEVDY
jgi:diaminopimelate epimerase